MQNQDQVKKQSTFQPQFFNQSQFGPTMLVMPNPVSSNTTLAASRSPPNEVSI